MMVDFMRRAVELARRGVGFTSPNPVVGAVIVNGQDVLGEGWHKYPGGPHAEVEALRSCADPRGADLYVSLEPCCHLGKTGPCTAAIINAGIKRVIVGMEDPNPLVAGKGMEVLRAAGIEVILCEDEDLVRECRLINQPFLKNVSRALPYVTLKAGMSLDGRITDNAGVSKWITSEAARMDARLERSICDAVLVGSGTLLADNPTLAAHGEFSDKTLLRVALADEKKLPRDLNFFRDDNYFCFSGELEDLLRSLYDRGVCSLFVEGGAKTHGSFYDAFIKNPDLIDKVLFYVSGKVMGGGMAKTVVAGSGLAKLEEAHSLKEFKAETCGDDLKISGLFNCY